MSRLAKLLLSVLSGTQDANIKFEQLRKLLKRLGFSERVKGDHFIFWKGGVDEIINLQPQPKGGLCKPYQVKQVRSLILNYRMGDEDV